MYPQSMIWSKNEKKYYHLSSENYFCSREILLYIAWACLPNKIKVGITLNTLKHGIRKVQVNSMFSIK